MFSCEFLHRWNSILLIFVTLLSLCNLSLSAETEDKCGKCIFPQHLQGSPKDVDKLRPLCGLRYSYKDEIRPEKYAYSVGICTVGSEDLSSNPVHKYSAVVQKPTVNKTPEQNGNLFILGRLNDTEIMTGKNWIYLEYEAGDYYGSSCQKEQRRTIIMIVCSPGDQHGTLKLLEENLAKKEECHYLFELAHDAACEKTPVDSGLSAGAVICIVLACVVGAYLLIGSLYMRCVVGAKGWKQIPNYSFWRDFGNLQADGCDLICRCGRRGTNEPKQYHGIGDHQIESANDYDQDEHLLPM